tara:strand:+ start:387 stop:971 length:585 start_codon:yes stop_codon:yes gene_type:complete
MQSLKRQLRKHFTGQLITLPKYKLDNNASEVIASLLFKQIPSSGKVLSFHPMLHKNEINLTAFNFDLANQNRLVLPKVLNNSPIMQCYQVKSIDPDKGHLIKSKYGIWEPNPLKCRAIHPTEIGTVIVPGLAFQSTPIDGNYYRLGRGGGYYDRFLKLIDPTIMKIGIAFKEQSYDGEIPRDSYDVPVDKVVFF